MTGPATENKEKFLTAQALRTRWGSRFSLQTLRNWRVANDRRGPAYIKICGGILYPIEAVEEFEKREHWIEIRDSMRFRKNTDETQYDKKK